MFIIKPPLAEQSCNALGSLPLIKGPVSALPMHGMLAMPFRSESAVKRGLKLVLGLQGWGVRNEMCMYSCQLCLKQGR